MVIRMIDGVDSEKNSVGQTFAASLDEPLMIDGNTVIPRGADAVVKLVDSKDSGKFTGRAELTLSLQSVKVNGRSVPTVAELRSIVADTAPQWIVTIRRSGETLTVTVGG